MIGGAQRVSERFEVTGIVQGVGFRPFVFRLATELGLDGSVGNDSSRVFIDVVGVIVTDTCARTDGRT